MTATFPNPPQAPLVDTKGNVHPQWYSWLIQLTRAMNALGGVPPTPTSSGVMAKAYKGAWNATTTYYPGDESSNSGNLYRCLVENLNVTPVNGTYWLLIGPLSQDNLANTANNTNIPTGYVDATRRIAAYKGGVNPLGSIPPGTCDVSFSYTSTTTTVTVSWTAGTLYRTDGTTTAIASGSQQITGLTASTTYYHGIYYDEVAGTIKLISGNGGVGTPAMAYTTKPAAASAAMIANGVSTFGWFTSATPASGSGGGGGSTGCCLHGEQEIELANGHLIQARDLAVDDYITGPLGPIRVVQLKSERWKEWYRVLLSDDTTLLVAGDHRFMDPAGEQIQAKELRVQQVVQARNCYVSIVRVEVARMVADKISIEVEAPHVYFVLGIMSHNKQLC